MTEYDGVERSTATEELRRLLDERGVEYRFNEITKVFEWHFEGTDGDGSAHATEVHGGINIIACSLTPEQAITATLESDGEYECKMDSLLCRLTGGLFSKTRAYSLDFMESCVEEAFEARNARPTSTTHAVTVSDESTDCATGHCECELCGQPIDPWDHFCRHCGAEVVDE